MQRRLNPSRLGHFLRALSHQLRHIIVWQFIYGARVELDVLKRRANLAPVLHHLSVLLPVYHQHLRLGHIVYGFAKQHHERFAQRLHVRQHLLVAGGRLRNQHGIASHSFVHFVIGAPAEKELSHHQPGCTRKHPSCQARISEQRMMPAAKECIRQGERWHSRVFCAQMLYAKLATPNGCIFVSNASTRWMRLQCRVSRNGVGCAT
ncbi:MAG: hypothetical protein L7S71_02535, partial [Pseudomonadales bacterium]|nr:hypothetical protein [Pseudomonadales bacterium]